MINSDVLIMIDAIKNSNKRLSRDEKDYLRFIAKKAYTKGKTTKNEDEFIQKIYSRVTGGGTAYRQVIG